MYSGKQLATHVQFLKFFLKNFPYKCLLPPSHRHPHFPLPLRHAHVYASAHPSARARARVLLLPAPPIGGKDVDSSPPIGGRYRVTQLNTFTQESDELSLPPIGGRYRVLQLNIVVQESDELSLPPIGQSPSRVTSLKKFPPFPSNKNEILSRIYLQMSCYSLLTCNYSKIHPKLGDSMPCFTPCLTNVFTFTSHLTLLWCLNICHCNFLYTCNFTHLPTSVCFLVKSLDTIHSTINSIFSITCIWHVRCIEPHVGCKKPNDNGCCRIPRPNANGIEWVLCVGYTYRTLRDLLCRN